MRVNRYEPDAFGVLLIKKKTVQARGYARFFILEKVENLLPDYPAFRRTKNVPRRTVRQQIVSIKNFRRQIFLCKIYKPKSKRKIPKNIQNGAHIFPISDKIADFFRYVLANIVCRIAADFWGKIKRRRLDNQRLSF